MYLDYFGLDKFPFRITPDPSMFFHGSAQGPGVVLDALVYAIESGEGMIKVVGEVGSGKTMLCRMLETRLPASIEIVYLANPSLPAEEIVHAVAFELKLETDTRGEKLAVMHKLQDYLLRKHAAGGAVVVFVEEAQCMTIDALEELRLLSNLETHQHKLMQIVLFGQPELEKNLRAKSIRQLRERITHSFYLSPLSASDIGEYLQFRMQAAGSPYPRVFSTKAEKLLSKVSAGLTRRINILADKSLMAAFASMSGTEQKNARQVQPRVEGKHVMMAVKDSGYQHRSWLPLTLTAAAATAVVVLVLNFWDAQLSSRWTDLRLAALGLIQAEDLGIDVAANDEQAVAQPQPQPQPQPAEPESPRQTPPAQLELSPEPLPETAQPEASPGTVLAAEADPVVGETVGVASDTPDTIESLLDAWITAWESRTTTAYLEFYAPDYRANYQTSAEWRAARRATIESASYISIDYEDVEILAVDSGQAIVEFAMYYYSSGYADRALKQITVRAGPDDTWRIVGERNLAVQRL